MTCVKVRSWVWVRSLVSAVHASDTAGRLDTGLGILSGHLAGMKRDACSALSERRHQGGGIKLARRETHLL